MATTSTPIPVLLHEKDTLKAELRNRDNVDESHLDAFTNNNGGVDHAEDHEWENDSIYEDVLDDVEPLNLEAGPNVCTPQEAEAYRNRLHEVGANVFVRETITAGAISAKKLCTAFGIGNVHFLVDAPDSAYYQVLGMAIARELAKRRRLPQYKTIDDAARLLQKSKSILVITGAGISTSLGIPDFRSKHTGFYSKLREAGYQEPEEVFDLGNFDDDPFTFYQLAGDILPVLNKWSPTHQFIRVLQDKNRLLRNYTQNIDNVESHAGIMPEKLIQCHGSWATATCRKCRHQIPGELIFDDIKAQKISYCKACEAAIEAQTLNGPKRKRISNGNNKPKKRYSDDDEDSDGAYDIPQPGVMKPDITFFGEPLPRKFYDYLRKHDRDAADLVIVIGTSMKVAPVSEVPQIIPPNVPQIYISRDPVGHINFDINLLGDSDTIVAELCKRAGWDLQHEMLPKDRKVDIEVGVAPDDHTSRIKAQG